MSSGLHLGLQIGRGTGTAYRGSPVGNVIGSTEILRIAFQNVLALGDDHLALRRIGLSNLGERADQELIPKIGVVAGRILVLPLVQNIEPRFRILCLGSLLVEIVFSAIFPILGSRGRLLASGGGLLGGSRLSVNSRHSSTRH